MLNAPNLKKLIKDKFGTVGRLADSIGVHRNSISNYLSGRPLLPKCVEKMLSSLGVHGMDVFLPTLNTGGGIQEYLTQLVDRLVKNCPEASIVLFGSRAGGRARKYSDIDLGILKGEPLSLKEWSNLRNVVDDTLEDFPFQVDLVDLGRVDPSFRSSVAANAKFLGGTPKWYFKLVSVPESPNSGSDRYGEA